MSKSRKVGRLKKRGDSRKVGGWWLWPDRQTAIQENNARRRAVTEGLVRQGESYKPSWYQRSIRGYREENKSRNAFVRQKLAAYEQLHPTASLNGQALKFINEYEGTRQRGNTARLNKLTKGTKRLVNKERAKNIEQGRIVASPRGLGGCDAKIFNYSKQVIQYSTIAFLNMYLRYAYKQVHGSFANNIDTLKEFSKDIFAKTYWDRTELFSIKARAQNSAYIITAPLLFFAIAYNFFEWKGSKAKPLMGVV